MGKSSILLVNPHSVLLIILVSLNVGHCVLNGSTTVQDNFKYSVFLKNRAFTSCSGVVIDEWHILTAAHCVYRNTPSQLSVYAGTVVLRRGITEIYDVHKIHIHRDYQVSRNSVLDMKIHPWPHHRANDIAILTLETPLLLGSYIEMTQLPTKGVSPFSLSECLITGWDVANLEDSQIFFAYRSWTEVVIVSPAYCQRFGISIRTNELCILQPLGVLRVANVDTGGALVCDGTLAGIIVTGNRDAHQPFVNANLHYFFDFVDRIKEEEKELYCSLYSP